MQSLSAWAASMLSCSSYRPPDTAKGHSVKVPGTARCSALLFKVLLLVCCNTCLTSLPDGFFPFVPSCAGTQHAAFDADASLREYRKRCRGGDRRKFQHFSLGSRRERSPSSGSACPDGRTPIPPNRHTHAPEGGRRSECD